MTVLEGKAILDHGQAIASRYARRVGPEVAEELRGEAVLRALRSPPPDGRMEPWLERIYRNLAVDRWRRGQLPIADGVDPAQCPIRSTPEDDACARERRRLVRASLRDLPSDARRALVARYFVGLDDDNVATRFGISTTTVRTRIHRALARLRARLGDLRAWCPPIFGKLASQAPSLGLAPVMVAALVVVGGATPEPAQPRAMPAARAVAPGRVAGPAHATVQKEDLPVVAPQPRSRLGKKPVLAHVPTRVPAAPERVTARVTEHRAEHLAIDSEEPVVADILRPDAIDVFAEPERPEPPCLVSAPTDFAPQVAKMIEEWL
jgi:RNA polymerase sigma-70 factor (ECF subfamily)